MTETIRQRYGFNTVSAEFYMADKPNEDRKKMRIVKTEEGGILFIKEGELSLSVPQELWLEIKRVF